LNRHTRGLGGRLPVDDRAVLNELTRNERSGLRQKSPVPKLSTRRAPWDKMGHMQRRDFVILAGAAAAMPMTIHAEEEPGNQSGNNNMAVPVIRISLGTFDAEKASVVEAKLIESKAALEPGIRGMRGNLGYYAGIDRKNNSMSNVSLWESIEAAEQMASFQPMLDLAAAFVGLGVRFQRPILNCATVWKIP